MTDYTKLTMDQLKAEIKKLSHRAEKMGKMRGDRWGLFGKKNIELFDELKKRTGSYEY